MRRASSVLQPRPGVPSLYMLALFLFVSVAFGAIQFFYHIIYITYIQVLRLTKEKVDIQIIRNIIS